MNITILIAGVLATFVVFGHFAFGVKWYLDPMLNSKFEQIPKVTMQSVFHYVSMFLVLAAIFLLLVGLGVFFNSDTTLLVQFIGINFILFTIIQIYYAIKNKIEKPLITMFQWTMFLPIGILSLIGA